MIERNIKVQVDPTPYELAFEFANMGDDNQAAFFSKLAMIVCEWDRPLCFQLQAIIDHPSLTPEGRELMRQIGEYGESDE